MMTEATGEPMCQPGPSEGSWAGPTDPVESEGSGRGPEADFFQEGGGGGPPQHTDCREDVVLRIEFISGLQSRVLIASQQLGIMAGFGLLIWMLVARHQHSPSWWFTSQTLTYVNLAFAPACLAGLLTCCGLYIARILRMWRTKRRWSHRRARMVTVAAIELACQTTGCTCWLAVTAQAAAEECPVLDWSPQPTLLFVTWTMWNLVFIGILVQVTDILPAWRLRRIARWLPIVNSRVGDKENQEVLIMDLPWWVHSPKLLLLFGTQSLVTAFYLMSKGVFGENACTPGSSCSAVHITSQEGPCTEWTYECHASALLVTLTSCTISALLLQLALFYLFTWVAFSMYRKLPFTEHRVANTILRYMIYTRLSSSLFFFLSLTLLWFAQMGTCASYAETRLGLAPLQVVAAVLVMVHSILYMPISPRAQDVQLHAALQEFAWLEADVPERLAARQARPEEPLFVFERALKLMYYSLLVYYLEDSGESQQPELSLDTALGLLGLTHWRLIWGCHSTHDSKCMMAWGGRTILVAFRGTDNLKNVRDDLKVWRTDHPPKRGSLLLGTRPLIHTGFWQNWSASQLQARVMEQLQAILLAGSAEEVEGGSGSTGPWRLYFTGHSLGGALATLAALDAAKAVEAGALGHPEGIMIQCYTFGAPRTGNHAFVREHSRYVPHTWNVVNGSDAVPKAGKFLFLFKHCKHRVIINPAGDLIVRPSFMESTMYGRNQASLEKHLLCSYQASFKAVMKAQFARKKGSKAGKRAIQQLLRSEYVQDMLVRSWQVRTDTMKQLLTQSPSDKPHVASDQEDRDLVLGEPAIPGAGDGGMCGLEEGAGAGQVER